MYSWAIVQADGMDAPRIVIQEPLALEEIWFLSVLAHYTNIINSLS